MYPSTKRSTETVLAETMVEMCDKYGTTDSEGKATVETSIILAALNERDPISYYIEGETYEWAIADREQWDTREYTFAQNRTRRRVALKKLSPLRSRIDRLLNDRSSTQSTTAEQAPDQVQVDLNSVSEEATTDSRAKAKDRATGEHPPTPLPLRQQKVSESSQKTRAKESTLEVQYDLNLLQQKTETFHATVRCATGFEDLTHLQKASLKTALEAIRVPASLESEEVKKYKETYDHERFDSSAPLWYVCHLLVPDWRSEARKVVRDWASSSGFRATRVYLVETDLNAVGSSA